MIIPGLDHRMRVRHKQPTLVSMWMLDVFCCALGCVTLLWLLNTRQAGDQSAAARSALQRPPSTRSELATAPATLDADPTQAQRGRARPHDQLAALRLERDQLGRKLGVAEAEAKSARELLDERSLAVNSTQKKLDARSTELAANAAKVEETEEHLRKKQKDVDAQRRQLAEKAAAADELAKLVREEGRRADRGGPPSGRTGGQDRRPRPAAVLRGRGVGPDRRREDEGGRTPRPATVKDLEKRLDDATATIIDLQGEKAKLADKIDKLQLDTDDQFAGIAMTGRRVVFLVDMSGSMD